MIQIPIIKIKKVLDGLLAYIKADIEANVLDETKSFLHRALYDNQDGDYNIYQQAKAIFTRESTSPKRINTSLFFTKNIQQIPHIFVRESANRSDGSSLGFIGDDLFLDEDTGEVAEGILDCKKTSIDLVVTSDNPLESIVISSVVSALFMSANRSLSEIFRTFSISEKELMTNFDTQSNLYFRSITIEASFENLIPKIGIEELLNEFTINRPTIT